MRFQLTTGTECTGLTTLILDGNDLDWLPGYLRTMTTLTHLSLRNCKFVKLPYFLGDLQNLKVVDVHGNDIAVPPSDIIARGVASMLKYMRAVDSSWWTKELDIAGQRFEQVGDFGWCFRREWIYQEWSWMLFEQEERGLTPADPARDLYHRSSLSLSHSLNPQTSTLISKP